METIQKEKSRYPGRGDGIASVVFAILALFLPLFLTTLISILGIYFGARAYTKNSKILGATGIILAVIALVVAIIYRVILKLQ